MSNIIIELKLKGKTSVLETNLETPEKSLMEDISLRGWKTGL